MGLAVLLCEKARVERLDEADHCCPVGVPHEFPETNFPAVEIFVLCHEFQDFLVVLEWDVVIDAKFIRHFRSQDLLLSSHKFVEL